CRCLDLDSQQLRNPPGFAHRCHHVLGRKFSHHKGQVTLDGCLDGFPINPLNVFSTASASAVHFHDKFCVLHSSPCIGWPFLLTKESRVRETTARQQLSRSGQSSVSL